jgi:transposase-like protein
MSFVQKLFKALLSKEKAEAMETESREWMLECPACKHETSVWDIGGIRYKASVSTRGSVLRCQKCGERGLHRLYRKQAEEQA